MSTAEEWRPVVGYEDQYEVSSSGVVRRSGRAARAGKGRGGGARIGLVLKRHANLGGYMQVQLWKDGKPKNPLVHVLVAKAFLGPAPDGKEVNHRSGVKADNSVGNLEYVTRSENNHHAWATGLRKPRDPEKNPRSKLTMAAAQGIRAEVAAGAGIRATARKHGVNYTTVRSLLRGKTWRPPLDSSGAPGSEPAPPTEAAS